MMFNIPYGLLNSCALQVLSGGLGIQAFYFTAIFL